MIAVETEDIKAKSKLSLANFTDIWKMADNDVEKSEPALLDGKFFSVISEKNGNIVAKCMNCINKTIGGTRRTTTNFLHHLKVSNVILSAY